MDLQSLVDKITAIKGVDESATAFILGVAAKIEAAVAQALENGATAEQLQPVQDVADAAKEQSDALAAAIAANP